MSRSRLTVMLAAGDPVRIKFKDARNPVEGKYVSTEEGFVTISVNEKIVKYNIDIVDSIEEV